MADPLWVWTALRMDGDPGQIATVAAEEFLNGTLSRMAFRAQGGIPVDRRGDFTGALRRAESVIRDEHRYLLIHPEGTRTRNGVIITTHFVCVPATLTVFERNGISGYVIGCPPVTYVAVFCKR